LITNGRPRLRTSSPANSLPFTGGDRLALLAIVGAGMLMVGLALTYLARTTRAF
jgi:uncharacterized surface anchored protein